METNISFCPDTRVIMGRVVSIVVAPPVAMGANNPKYFAIKGAQSSVIISLKILASRAMVPNSAPLYWVIKILDSE